MKKKTSKYKYVSRFREQWRAWFVYQNINYYIGLFGTELAAYRASMKKRRELGIE